MAGSTALEAQIGRWRDYVSRHRAIAPADVDEMTDHLRERIGDLQAAGLDDDEAFLVAVKRMGNLDALSREFARAHSERLWKQLVIAPDLAGESPATSRTEAFAVFGFAVAAAFAVKVPELFGLHLADGGAEYFYARNATLFVLPLLAAYFLWKRGAGAVTGLWLALPFAAGAAFVNLYPFRAGGDTEALTILHLPIALWLAIGFAYVGGRWFAGNGRMDFVRFSGELAIYYVLIALGGGVFTGFTLMMFRAIGTNAEWLAQGWLIPCGAAGAVIVGSWLVEAKQSVVENMAPVLTRIFTPLFTLVLLAFVSTMLWTGSGIDVRRELLIGFDLLLVLVVGLLLYSISARDPLAPPDAFDALQFVLVVTALIVDALALAAIAGRISAEPGGSARREPDPHGEPDLVGLALRPVPGRPRLLCRPGTLADGLPAGVRGVGGPRRHPVPTAIRFPVTSAAASDPRSGKIRACAAPPVSSAPRQLLSASPWA
jgi:hypothetical protein